MASESHIEVVDPDCRSVIEQNIEIEISQKCPLYKGDTVSR
jgi:hypothetical protein